MGIVTEWDFVSRLVAAEKDPESVSLGDVMSVGLVSVGQDATFESVARLMAERRIRRVLVVQDGVVAGVVTSREVMARMKEYVDQMTAHIARFTTAWDYAWP